MSISPLAQERCQACEGGIPPLTREELAPLCARVHARWVLAEDAKSIVCDLRFKSFARAMAFLNRVAELAEDQGHHPDFCLHAWNKVRLTLSTHAIGGLSRNDFIIAAGIDDLLASN